MSVSPEHPLRIEDVAVPWGSVACLGLARHDSLRVCGVMQRASKMPLEPAEDPSEITAYRCRNGCAVLLVTGHPSPIPLPSAQRFWIGDYGIGANTTAGIEGFPRRPAVRIVALLIVALLTAGCAAAEPTVSEAPTAPTRTPSQEPVATQTTEAPTPTRTKAPVKRTGAAARVPRRVIMEQLAKRAERIAASMASASPEVLPTDVDPDSNRGLGYRLMLQFGLAADQWQYLDALWQRESGWNHLAENASSGAYGIPQSLPGSKMADVAPDWRTNAETQITWGLAYIAARYDNPQGAWGHSQRVGWY